MRRFSGDALRKFRNTAGYSATEMADQLGIAFQSVYRYELGQTQPSADTIAKFADFFGIAIDDLFEGTGPNGTATYPALTQEQRDGLLALLGVEA